MRILMKLTVPLAMCTCRTAFCFASGNNIPHSTHWGTRLFSLKGGSMPESEEMKPFYALGVNIGRQVESLSTSLTGYSD